MVTRRPARHRRAGARAPRRARRDRDAARARRTRDRQGVAPGRATPAGSTTARCSRPWVTPARARRGHDLPRRVLVGALPEDHAVLAEALARRAGRAVELLAPARGRARRLVRDGGAQRRARARAARRARRRSPRPLLGRRARRCRRRSGCRRRRTAWCASTSRTSAPDQAVAAVVASEDGQPRKSLYRRMRMRRPGPDDFAMIGEAVERYWARVESGELPRPDLVVIDGGVGQLGAAREALDRVGDAARCRSSDSPSARSCRARGRSALTLPRRAAALRALQRLRDEAHRFGLDVPPQAALARAHRQRPRPRAGRRPGAARGAAAARSARSPRCGRRARSRSRPAPVCRRRWRRASPSTSPRAGAREASR